MFSVTVKNLVKRFGTNTVLNELSFSHSEGIMGIAGPNGSGKSTLLKCLAGLVMPTSGSVSWRKGESGLNGKELKIHLGFIAPYINLYHELTVMENLKFILRLRGKTVPAERIDRHLARLELAEIRHRPFGELSTGQQQRARLACTLIYNPSILFLDEPGANLDKKGISLIRNIVEDFRNEDKLIFLASNNQKELELSDRILSVKRTEG